MSNKSSLSKKNSIKEIIFQKPISEGMNQAVQIFDKKPSSQETQLQKKIKLTEKIWKETSEHMQVLHLSLDNQQIDGKNISVFGKNLTNFGSCSYFGLETDPRVKKASIDAIKKFGTQYSSSITYSSLYLYKELKEKYLKLFGANPILGPTTTLSHLACIPTLISENDIILIDQQAHNSVQMACQIAGYKGTKIYTLPHNNLAALEEKISRHPNQKIWYVADGIYSMYGDRAPIKELEALRNKFENLYLYIDDAHGIGWEGTHGKGYALNTFQSLKKTVVVASHAKCFGSGGGTIIIEDKQMSKLVESYGPTLIFSGPIQPGVLGASSAVADIFLSDEINKLQKDLNTKMAFRNHIFENYNIPTISYSLTPITFVCVGDNKAVGKLFHELFNEGFLVNCAIFPAVSPIKSGIRFTTTLHQTESDIERLAKTIAKHLPKILKENKTDIESVYQLFNVKKTKALLINNH